MNPTTDVFEKRMAALEGGVGGAGLRRRLSAVDRWPSSTSPAPATTSCRATSLYGGTYNLFVHTFRGSASTPTFVDPADPENFRRGDHAPTPRAVFAETVGNPKIDVLDFAAVADIAHEAGVPLVVDNTVPRRTCAGPSITAPTSWCTRRPSSSAATAPPSAA